MEKAGDTLQTSPAFNYPPKNIFGFIENATSPLIIIIQVINISFCCIFSKNNIARISYYNGMRWDIKIYIRIWCNQNIVTNSNFPHHSCINTYPYSISYYWNTFSCSSIFLSYCYTFMDITIFTNYRLWIDSNTIRMSYI